MYAGIFGAHISVARFELMQASHYCRTVVLSRAQVSDLLSGSVEVEAKLSYSKPSLASCIAFMASSTCSPRSCSDSTLDRKGKTIELTSSYSVKLEEEERSAGQSDSDSVTRHVSCCESTPNRFDKASVKESELA